jgi:signal transduction histidine kinase
VHAQRTFRTVGRGLWLVATSLPVGIPVFVASAVSVALMSVEVGEAAVPAATRVVRAYADAHRRRAWDWSRMRVDRPYRGDASTSGWRSLIDDPATWRDLAFTLIMMPVGMVFGLLPLCLLGNAVLGLIVAPFVWAFSGSQSPYWPIAVSTGRLRASRAEIVDASAAELRRIERDLHDGAQARLVALGMTIGLAEQLLRTDPDAAAALLAEAHDTNGQALRDLRDLVRGIHPPVLSDRGLDGAIRALAAAMPLSVVVDIELCRDLEAPLSAAVHFAVAEALTNVAKHSGATQARVHVRDGARLTATVGDNGHGGADLRDGGGLAGLRRRLDAFDGTLQVTSPRGGPTVIAMELPCGS